MVGQLFGVCPDIDEPCLEPHYVLDGRLSATYPNIAEWLNPSTGTGPCTPGSTTLCLDDLPGDRRYTVTMRVDSNLLNQHFDAPALQTGSIGVTKGGLFYYNNPANPEVLIKVLNGCPLNSRRWVFYAAGTTLGFTIRVIDTTTGVQWTRTNPDGSLAPPVADQLAFSCP